MPSYLVAATLRSSLSQGGWLGGSSGFHLTGFVVAVLVLSVITAPLSQLIIGAALSLGAQPARRGSRPHPGRQPESGLPGHPLPRLRPAIGFSGVIALLYAISDFGAVAVLDVPVLTWRLYLAVESTDVAKAAVLGGAILLATLPLLAAARVIRGQGVGPGSANVRPPTPVALSTRSTLAHAHRAHRGPGYRRRHPARHPRSVGHRGHAPRPHLCRPWAALGDTLVAACIEAMLTVALAWLPAAVQARKKLESRTVSTSRRPAGRPRGHVPTGSSWDRACS